MTKKEKINVFVSANNGFVEIYKGVGNKIGTAKTAKMLAYILDTHKIYEPVYFSSSMDFADEYGFAHYNDAKTMWDKAIDMRKGV